MGSETLSATIDLAPAFSENAIALLKKRYLRTLPDGNLETPEQMIWRIAKAVALAERGYGDEREVQYWTETFARLLASLEFLPNSPTIRNAGTENSLSACFVVPITDSMEGIMDAAKQAAMIIKSGGGVGFDFSDLRPRGAPIRGTHNAACGPLAVMDLINQLSDSFTQGGGAFRKGAMMFELRVDHPDVREFIHLKDGTDRCLNANISVSITEAFLEALRGRDRGDFDFDLQFQGEIYDTVDAREIWREIAESAHKTGDPGLFFVDRVNGEANPIEHYSRIAATNPCGEVALTPYESCNLGSIDVAKFVDPTGTFAWERLAVCVRQAVRFLDDVVSVNTMPTPETQAANLATRRIGLGIMGWADALAALRIPYGSERAVNLAKQLMQFIRDSADDASLALGQIRGVYGVWHGSVHADLGLPFRNAFRLSQAPTGSIAILADCSSGIEPIFAREWNRKLEDGTVFVQQYPAFARWAEESGDASGEVPEYLRTAMEIDPIWHVRMQAAFQTAIDCATSKTINLSHDATVDDVMECYQLAIDTGCRGITIFRDGCRDEQVLTVREASGFDGVVANGTQSFPAPAVVERTARQRLPDERPSYTHKFTVGDQEGYLTVGVYDDGRPGELFMHVSKQGSTINGLVDAVAVVISIALQHGVPLHTITRKLAGTRFDPAGMTRNPQIPSATSLIDYVAEYLDRRFSTRSMPHSGRESLVQDAQIDYTLLQGNQQVAKVRSGVLCPDCGLELWTREGCLSCMSCGYQKCG